MTTKAVAPGDNAGHFPDLKSARDYVAGKTNNTSPDYHRDRMRALNLLIDQIPADKPLKVIDFGCGDGMYFQEFIEHKRSIKIDKIVGIDISEPMVQLAAENLNGFNFTGKAGGVDVLKEIQGEQFDLALAIDVLGYLSEEELNTFYTQMARLVKPGGHLIVMYGNELFDMFALNSGTAAFYQKHFGLEVADLLTEGRSPQYKTADRKNPMNFGAQIRPYGFNEIKQSYSQWHKVPPAIGNKASQDDLAAARLNMRDHAFDPNTLDPRDMWKAMIRCSIFASLSTRV